MGRHAQITRPWGDGDYTFRLGVGELVEHDEKCRAGPAWVAQSLTNLTWRAAHVRETIRLGLIGGGMAPVEALKLVKRYVDERPLMESVPVAFDILMAARHGSEDEPLGKAAAAEAQSQPSEEDSPSPPSTEMEPLSASAPTPSTG